MKGLWNSTVNHQTSFFRLMNLWNGPLIGPFIVDGDFPAGPPLPTVAGRSAEPCLGQPTWGETKPSGRSKKFAPFPKMMRFRWIINS